MNFVKHITKQLIPTGSCLSATAASLPSTGSLLDIVPAKGAFG